jgi:hypothetical protein
MKSYFFEHTRNAHLRISEIYDFAWPTIAAMWSLRKQINDYLKANPNATDYELDEKFAHPANIRGASLKSAWMSRPIEAQHEEMARILLINIVAVYEGWVRNLLIDLQSYDGVLAKAFEFTEATHPAAVGVESALAFVTTNESLVLKGCFYDTLQTNKMYTPAQLKAMMVCFRYFKELRNCEVHNSGLANSRLVDAYNDLARLKTAEELGCYKFPKFHQPVIGQKTKVELFGVTGLNNIVLRMIVTLDAEMSRSAQAEHAFVKKWRPIHPQVIKLPNDERQRNTMLRRLFQEADFPVVENTMQLRNVLLRFGLAYERVSRSVRIQQGRMRNQLHSASHGVRRIYPVDKY